MLRKILKLSLILLVSLLLIGLACYAIFVLKWQLWTLLIILLCVAVLVIGGLFVRKLLARRREERFVDQVIQRDEMRLKELSAQEKDELKEMQRKWKEAIETLKKSHLRKQGNPLYVLPWYMVMGESGSGKTTAIQSARITSPFADFKKVSGISGTRNCDWWFFENAIVIDTAGRYAIPIDEGRDKGDWNEFLPMLAKYRKKEPLNGLIVTVAADKLLTSSPENLAADAQTIRSRLNETMVALGAKFPVYLLVTKCDLIEGMAQFCKQLPESCLQQAMGCLNEDFSQNPVQFTSQVSENLDEHLRRLRLLILHETRSSSIDSALMLFPDEFEKLTDPLKTFAQGVFESNPYQETPLLRGIFYSSGAQQGVAYSHFLRKLGLSDDKTDRVESDDGLFLHDFFASILPGDRKYFAPTQRALEWKRATKNLGFTAWGVLCVFVGLLLSLSFYRNYVTISDVPQEFVKAPVLSGAFETDLSTMGRFREATLELSAKNANWPWWLHHFGLNHGLDVEKKLKDTFCEQFKINILTPLDQKLVKNISGFSSSTRDEIIAAHVNQLSKRLILLKARAAQKDDLPTSATSLSFKTSIPDDLLQEQGKYDNVSQQYLSYIKWSQNFSQLNLEQGELTRLLRQVLIADQNNLRWLVVWANQQGDLKPVLYNDFWTVDVAEENQRKVQAAFTLAGKQRIADFLDMIQQSFPEGDNSFSEVKRQNFEKWYKQAYLEEWLNFAKGFPQVGNLLAAQQKTMGLSRSVTTSEGPYFSFLDRLALELESFMDDEKAPDWVKLVFYHQIMKIGFLAESPTNDDLSFARRVAERFTKWGHKFIAGVAKVQDVAGNRVRVERLYFEYRRHLEEVVKATFSKMAAYQEASAVFQQDPASGEANSRQAHRKVLEMSSLLESGNKDSAAITALIRGPLDFLWILICHQTACHLQDLWEKDVIAEVGGLQEGQAMYSLLMGDGGVAKEFIRGVAAPFISRSAAKGYYPVKALGETLPLTQRFFSFLTKTDLAARTMQDTYKVTLGGLPTSINSDAHLKPRATYLTMSCDDGLFELANFNFPVKKSVRWSPKGCGDVTLKIELGDLLLTVKYTGENAFARFLRDYKNGRKRYTPKDFPKENLALKGMYVKFIEVNYALSGHKNAVKLIEAAPGRPPSSISACQGF